MSFFFGNLFWGILLLLWGASLILKEFVKIDLPLVKIFFALVIIMFGIRLLVGGSHHHRINSTKARIISSGGSEYTTIFGSQAYDLTGIKPNSAPLEITAVFGSAYVELPDDIDFEIEPTAVFGSTVVPPKPANATSNPRGTVKIEASAIFGRVEFVFRKSARPVDSSNSAAADTTKE